MRYPLSSRPKLRIALMCIGGLLILYALLGFLLVPWLIERRLASTLQERLDLQAEVEAVHFNPFFFTLEMDDLQVVGREHRLLELAGLSVNLAPTRLIQGVLRIDEVGLRQPSLTLVRYSDTEHTLSRLTRRWKETAPEEPEEEAEPMTVELGRARVLGGTLQLMDRVPASEAALEIGIHAEAGPVDSRPGTEMPFLISITTQPEGRVTLDGSVQLLPALDLSADARVQSLSITPLQPYVNEMARVGVDDGVIDLEAAVASNAQEDFSYKGNFILSDVKISDRELDELLASLQALSIESVDFSLSDASVDLLQVEVASPYIRVLINGDGESNIGKLMRSKKEEDTDSESEDDPASLSVSLDRVTIVDAESQFSDLSLPLVFDTQMRELNGEIGGYASASGSPLELDLEGRVGEFGQVTVAGETLPRNISQETSVDLTFRSLDLPDMSPYTVAFAGREIADGEADVELVYRVRKGDLEASNNIVIRDLALGDKVDHEDAMDLPLDLAVALLQNSEGIIELEIPVKGDVNNPEFQLAGVIRDTIMGVLRDAVTSPFRLLGGLVGGSEEEIRHIQFEPGQYRLPPPAEQTLAQLADALTQRPQLALRIPAAINTEADTRALQANAVDARIEVAMDEPDTANQEQTLTVMEALYNEAGLSPELEEVRSQFANESNDNDVDTQAYADSLRERLIEAEPVTETQLQTLATARAEAVTQYLQDNGALDQGQLRVGETTQSDLDDDDRVPMEFAVKVSE